MEETGVLGLTVYVNSVTRLRHFDFQIEIATLKCYHELMIIGVAAVPF